MSENTANTQDAFTQAVASAIADIRPMLQADGGDIELVEAVEQTGVISVRLQGACRGCPAAQQTLKMVVQRHVQEKVPQVTDVVPVE